MKGCHPHEKMNTSFSSEEAC